MVPMISSKAGHKNTEEEMLLFRDVCACKKYLIRIQVMKVIAYSSIWVPVFFRVIEFLKEVQVLKA